jgi:hypothetical protein
MKKEFTMHRNVIDFDEGFINHCFQNIKREQGVEDKHVDMINRWRTFENALGKRPKLSMHDHYSDIEIMIPELVKFSLGLLS